MPTVQEELDDAEERLKASDDVEHPHAGKERIDAEELMAFVLEVDELEPRDVDRTLKQKRRRRFESLLERRLTGIPTAYLTGSTRFLGLKLEVGPGAFIPRESSEFMAQQAIRRLRGRRAPVHVDLATGIGPVALAVASKVPAARVFGVDISRKPIEQARRNAERLGLSNATFRRGDLFEPLPGKLRGTVDVFTIHPPYVPKREVRGLPREIKAFEPEESLTDYSPTGLRLLRKTVDHAPEWLRPGGWLLVEVSPDRAREVRTILVRGGFGEVRSTKDQLDVSRVIVGRSV